MSDLPINTGSAGSRTAPVNREIELTLHVDAKGLDHIARQYDFLPSAERDRHPRQDRHQRTTYFDTSDLALFKTGVALRLREESGRITQTLKTVNAATVADSAAVAVRQEWDWPITGTGPVPALLDADGLGVLVPQTIRDRLEPLFHTTIRRRSWIMHPDALTSVEVALDQGETVLRNNQIAVAEVELELKEGRVAHLFGLALAIHAITPVRIATESKAELGFRLASSRPCQAVAPTNISLSPLTTVAEAFRYSVRDAIRLLLANQPCVLRNSDPAGLAAVSHALRRIDSAIHLFRPVLAGPQASELQGRLKEIRRVINHALAWDCLQTAIQTEPEGLRQAVRQAAINPMEAARAALIDPRHTETILQLAFWIEDGRWLTDSDDATRKLLDQPLNALSAQWLTMAADRVRKLGKRLDGRKNRKKLHRRLTQLFDARSLMSGLVPASGGTSMNEQTAATLAEVLEITSVADQLRQLLAGTPLAQNRAGRRAANRLNREFARDGDHARKALPALWRLVRRPVPPGP